jgi:hypothetical protein
VLGCGGSQSTSTAPSAVTTTTAPPSPSPTARYRVTFEATWSRETHPNRFPANPHFSGLIGATHQSDLRFWEVGRLASDGIEAMAERGSKSPFDQEIQMRIAEGRAENLLSGGDVPRSPGTVSLELTISTAHSAVTLVSMIAPSPDWFVGVSALDLIQDGDWADELVVDLHPYDAGTDSGTTYDSRDRDTVPPAAISRIEGPPLQVGGMVPPLGTFTFRRQ